MANGLPQVKIYLVKQRIMRLEQRNHLMLMHWDFYEVQKKWFNANTCAVFYRTSIVDIPEPMSKCEELFDKNVLPIKKLVKGIGNLDDLIIKERKKKIYMMIVT